MLHADFALPAARVGLAILVNGLWQGPLIAFAAWLALYLFRSANAATRYAVWSLALLAVLVVPVFTSLSRITVEPVPSQTAALSTNAAHVTAASTRPTSASTAHLDATKNANVTNAPVRRAWVMPSLRLGVPNIVALVAVVLWLAVSLAIVVRLIAAFMALERLKRDSLPLSLEYRDAMESWARAMKGSRDVRICVSEAIEVPIAVGLFDSMILLPTHLVQSLDPTEIDQITLHELGHLLRGDDWTNAIQRIASALLFFNPAVWFISRQMDVEREVACDDYVLQLTGAVRPYAFCLTKMAEMTAWPHRPMPAPGVFITRKNISIRIERLLRTGRAIGSSIAPNVAVSATVAMIATFLVLRTMTPSFAYSDESSVSPLPSPPPVPIRAANVVKKPVHAVAPIVHVAQAPKHIDVAVPAIPPQHLSVELPSTPPIPKIAAEAVKHSVYLTKQQAETTKRIAESIKNDMKIDVKRYASVALTFDNCSGCNFAGANLAGHDFSKVAMEGANFSHANLSGARFDRASLSGANFTGANLRNVSFRNANLEGCNLRGADLDGADFTGAHLTGCDIDARHLAPEQARVFLNDCEGCDFSGANLRGMDLRHVHLTGTNLADADLRDANLSGADLEGVNFAGAHLAGAKLDGANLTGCNLNGVDLRGVDLSHTSLTGSSLSGAIWEH